MVTVKAAVDIRTDAGFTVAKAGTPGTLVEGATPSLPHNYDKVLVRFEGRERGYWVNPAALEDGVRLIRYISKQPKLAAAPGPPRRGFAYDYDFGSNCV
jgi:hypothetical protein